MQNKTKLPIFEIVSMIVGEIITSAVIIAVFMIVNLIKKQPLLHYSVVLGAVLGSLITVMKFILLSVLTTRAVNNALANRGETEMTDEEAAAFAKEHQAKLQLAMTVSYAIRIATMGAALIVAFIFKEVFNPIATIIPIFMLRPILTATQLLLRKKEGNNG